MIRGTRLLLTGICALAACQPRGPAPLAAAPGAPAQPRPAPINLATACAEPWGSGPFTEAGPPLAMHAITPPARAAAEHVSGCAGLRFRIGADGVPTDIEVLVEAPSGYGFGQAAAQAVGASRWAPRADDSFHYVVERID
jgi:hypothetical protein